MRECQRLAAALGMPANPDENSEELWVATELQGEGEADGRKADERMAGKQVDG